MVENISLWIAIFIILWSLCGFIALIASILKRKTSKQKVFPDGDALQIITGCILLGPLTIWAIIGALKDNRRIRREKAGWWELKEYGGKY